MLMRTKFKNYTKYDGFNKTVYALIKIYDFSLRRLTKY